MYSADCYHRPPQHHNTITLDPADTHFSYLNTILGCWTFRQNALQTLLLAHRKTAVYIYRMLLFLLHRVNYIRYFITFCPFLISILCTTLRMSMFNKELLTIFYGHCVNAQVGTSVCVDELFSTLPVRRKEFLRNLKKDFAQMIQTLTAYCLISNTAKITCSNQLESG